jgi:uncharacterized protein
MESKPRPRGSVIVLVMIALCLSPDPGAAQTEGRGQAIGERITIANGASRLAGSVLVPAGPGPHPAFVAIEGSGGASYRQSWVEGRFPFWKDIAEFLVARGYAVLLFDKPGVNESTGDWRRQSFDDRADEVIAAVRQLGARDDIDAARIGLVGHSQGGWIGQIAAARHPTEVAFLVSLAGPAVSVSEQIRDDVEGGWACRGLSRTGYAVRTTGLRAGLGALGLVARVATPGYLTRIINFDPHTVLPGIRQPTLAIFAEHDPLVVPQTNRARWHQHFGVAANNRRLAVATVADADHAFRASALCPSERPTEWAPGFFEALGDRRFWNWIERDGGTAA